MCAFPILHNDYCTPQKMNECHLKRDRVQKGNKTSNPTINFQWVALSFSVGRKNWLFRVHRRWDLTQLCKDYFINPWNKDPYKPTRMTHGFPFFRPAKKTLISWVGYGYVGVGGRFTSHDPKHLPSSVFQELLDDPQIKAAVLTGAHGVFCGGPWGAGWFFHASNGGKTVKQVSNK